MALSEECGLLAFFSELAGGSKGMNVGRGEVLYVAAGSTLQC